MVFDILSFFLGALSGAAVVGVFWVRDYCDRIRSADDWDRFGPY